MNIVKGLERIPECKTVHVSIVDGYQGQENKIILLSLVRSNDTGQVGFLKTENRVCVALSRARDGLFIIGNMEQLCRSGPLWKKINRSLRETDSVGEALTLRCENHPEQVNQVIKAADFKKYSPEGGCKLPCLKKLPSCGHTCPRICHVVDSTHEKMKCMENVLKYCERGSHKYKYHCSENRTCMKKIKIKLPQCQHIKEITCSADETEEKCTAQCSEVLDCGHVCQQPCHFDNDPDHEQYVCRAPCSLKAKGCYADHTCPRECWKDCSSCEVKVHKIAKCGHSVTVKCSFDMTEYTCRNLCRRLLECKHKCPRKCWEKCGGCNMMVEKILPVCKHTVKLACNADLTGFLCQEPCDRRFECEHKCSRKCSEECRTCLQKVTKTLPECGHTALVPCEEDASGYPCTMPCERILPCGHRCLLKCSEKCSGRNCSTIVCKERTCGHSVLLVECSYSMLAYKCQLPCERIMQCGHRCLRDCWEECGGCQEPVKKVLGQCGHLVEVPCCSDPINADCDEPCQRILNCGHRCPKPCYAPCTTLCREPRSSVEKCFAGHVAQLPCYISTERDDAAVAAVSEACKAACSAILECGHTCSGSCSSCLHGRLHQPCREPCKRRLLCGHRCQTVCGEPCPPCSQRCHRCCPHMRCASKCAEPCSKCPRECGFVCPHARGCGKDCSECKCVPCLFACPKILPCGHACVGYCGDPCPSLCRVCDGDQLKKSCLRAMVPEELAVARFVLLPDCGDTFEYNGLRTWLRMPDDNVSTKRCPLCRANIFNCQRFEKYIKKFYKSAHQALVVYKTSIKPISTIADLIKDNDSGQVLSSLLSINVICNSPLVQSVQVHLDGRADTIPAQELIKFHFQAAFIVTAGSMLTNLTPKKDLLNLLKKVLEQELVPANQFRQEVSCEMQRIGFLDTLSTMRSSAPPELLPRITAVLHQHLAPTKPFTSAREWHVDAFLLQLKNVTPKLKFTTRRMDSSELTARTMCNGAWFTCPKGHVLFRMPDEKESVCMGCLNPKKKSCIVM